MREDFCVLLDNQPLRHADAIFVLRNHDQQESVTRIKHAVKILLRTTANVLLMSFDEHTRAEADHFVDIAKKCKWHSVVLITHKHHHYRAFLTFLEAALDAAHPMEIISSPVESGLNELEFVKIEQYQEAGHIASYEEGIAWLKLQTAHHT